MKKSDECLILIKALPHRSSNYFETVCCAGIGRDGNWRRQYPVPFRILTDNQVFRRWDWIAYDFVEPRFDKRVESQKVVPETIKVLRRTTASNRFKNIQRNIRSSLLEASSLGDSLTLIRPKTVEFFWRAKTLSQLQSETIKHEALANQFSFFDKNAKPLTPCPYTFYFSWTDQNGRSHRHTCDDWETSSAFFVRRKSMQSADRALASLKNTFEVEYLSKGMVFGLGTHARRKDQWLLVGILRVDIDATPDLFG
jgi:hypothetical protein